jgi:hypothetical protein
MPATAPPSARAPQYSEPKAPDKRKFALFAGVGAAVVVVAVVVYLVLSSGNGGSGNTNVGQSPSNAPSATGTPPKSGTSSSAPAGLVGETRSESKITAIGATGKVLVNFYGDPAANWNLLTPAAQAVYGDEQTFQQYWADNKKAITSYDTASVDDPAGPDGSVLMSLNILGGRHKFHMVILDGKTLIDANTKLDSLAS